MSASREGARGRILPALLDRLTDDHPRERAEGDASRTFSFARLREAVLRDLSWLLNTSQLETTIDLAAYPDVAASTLNYGVRSRTGYTVEGLPPSVLRREILTSLRRFEPRFLPESLEVTIIEDSRQDGTFQFRIEADLWAQPLPLRMLMRTEVGDITGTVRVVEMHSEAS
jgi:type VI secretion system protein ImpF